MNVAHAWPPEAALVLLRLNRPAWTALLLLPLAACHRGEPAPLATGKPWLGVVGLAPKKDADIPETGGRRFPQALRISAVVPGSPADRAGMKPGDFVVASPGVDFAAKLEDLPRRFRDTIGGLKPGDTLRLTVVRDRVDRDARLDGKPLEEEADPEALLESRPPGPRYTLSARRRLELINIKVRLEPMPGSRKLPLDEAIFPEGFPVSAEETLARDLVKESGWEDDVQDLCKRLAACEENPDPWRLSRMAYAHRNPFKLPQVSQRLIRETVTDHPSFPERIRRAAAWLDRSFEALPPRTLKPAGATLKERLDEIAAVLDDAKIHYDKAFSKLTADDLAFLDKFLDTLLKKDSGDLVPPPRMLALAERVDFAALFQAAAILADFVEQAQGPVLQDLKGGGRRDTLLGPIVIAGPGRDRHTEEAAVLIDLGGDDFYTSRAGSSGPGRPFSIVIDCGGNDAYESSRDFSQGCGRLGIGILADLDGDDQYLCQDWGQGCAVLGVGILLDRNGNDVYRGGDGVQAAALWGIALALEEGGEDAYGATALAQACGLPGGFALLADARGNDRYFAKGRHPTGYGDPGLFDAMSQGCGLGLREVRASGGIGLLADLYGNDRYEAGHFSQGGGYYFGWGLLHEGAGNDAYVGSRYAQGFAAHQALGTFEDGGGDDHYDTRQSVAQGCSWDETVVTFLDRGGNDVYEGDGFCKGASAHNGFCLFIDYGGDDIYRGAAPARAGPNDYHEGTSLSVVIDAGGGKDAYEGEARDGAVTRNGAHGVFMDLMNDLANPVDRRADPP